MGSGSFGTTFKAIRTKDQQIVAIKEMMVRKADSVKVLELFEREAKTLEALNHPGVPTFFEDFVIESGRNSAYYLVQEFIEGETLWQAFEGPTSSDQVVDACLKILNILEYLHSFSPPVIHRDIKPQNVLRRFDGQLVLIDFGSVKLAMERGDGSTIAGTFGYMAPEQFLGQAVPQSDIYALGALAVALLTKTDPQLLLGSNRLINLDDVPIDASLKSALQTFLAADPKDRPTASEAKTKLAERKTSSLVTAPKNQLQLTPNYVVLRRYQHQAAAAIGGFGVIGMAALLMLVVIPSLSLFAIPLMAIFLVFIIVAVRQKRHAERLVENGERTQCSITNLQVVAQGSTLSSELQLVPQKPQLSVLANYEFEVGGSTYGGTWEGLIYSDAKPSEFLSDRTVAVAYNSTNPKDHIFLIEGDVD